MSPTDSKIPVLYEDNHLLVVVKPPGLPTMGVSEDQPSLVIRCKEYVKRRYNKPGNVYLGVVSRLDSLATGVIVLARTSKAARRLNEQFREARVGKTYWALVEQPPHPPQGECIDWVGKNEREHRMEVVSAGKPKAQKAMLTYRIIRRLSSATLVEVELKTGRKHQIRLQLASRGWPILGDRKYEGRRKFPEGIALLSRRLELEHPVLRKPLHFTCPVPAAWEKWGVRNADFETADGE